MKKEHYWKKNEKGLINKHKLRLKTNNRTILFIFMVLHKKYYIINFKEIIYNYKLQILYL